MNTSARSSTSRHFAMVAALLVLVLTGGTALASDTQRLSFPVTLADGRTYTVVGYLHSKHGYTGKPLQVLLHGATYTHAYWDMPEFDRKEYSYAEYMTQRGYAVLALDLLGSGESSRPDGDFLDLALLSNSVHQVVARLRNGQNQLGARWRTIIGVGHSLGSAAAIHAQATYRSFDAIVTTGLGHVPHEMPISPDFGNRAMATPYFYLSAAERAGMFYHAPKSTQEIINYDNARFGGPMSRGLFLTVMVGTFDPSISRVRDVRGPVLVQLGENDGLFPASYAAQEASWWPRASVTVQTVPDVGHSVNTHKGRRESWRKIEKWLRSELHPRDFRD